MLDLILRRKQAHEYLSNGMLEEKRRDWTDSGIWRRSKLQYPYQTWNCFIEQPLLTAHKHDAC